MKSLGAILDVRRSNWRSLGLALVCLPLAIPFSAQAEDLTEEALGEVRHTKAELYSDKSSVLGKLPGPAELAAHQLRSRPRHVPKAGTPRKMKFDDATRAAATRATARHPINTNPPSAPMPGAVAVTDSGTDPGAPGVPTLPLAS